MQKLTLKNVLICLILFLLLTTMIISISSSYVMQKQTLVDNTLERHESYARKLANSAELSIQDAHKMLAESAKVIGAQFTQPVLDAEMERVIAQSSTFNSVSVINKDGIFVSAHPFKNFVGEHIVTEDALHVTVPMISKPYAAVTGRLVITLTYPIFNEAEDYLGYISGAIYLQEQNIFSALMETHFLQDDSYVFVVDEKGTIIYHQDRDRINEDVSSNAVVQEVLAQNSGATQVINSKNITMLAGYSFIEGANWGVVSQKPFLSTVLPAQQMVMNNFSLALPFLLIAVALSILFIAKIVKPIHILTELTKQNAEQQSVDKIRDVNGWYHEANQLKQTLFMTFTALQGKVHTLQTEATSDALTNLLNRRAITRTLEKWDDEKTPYAVILMDIDKFKLVNDTYGHQMGDDVLVYFANFFKKHTMPYHLCGRYGGEEFIILMPNATLDEAVLLADAIRKDVSQVMSPTGNAITISAGVAHSDTSSCYKHIIERADMALYNAKEHGRNQVCS